MTEEKEPVEDKKEEALPVIKWARPITTSIIIPVIIANQDLLEMTVNCLKLISETVDRNDVELIMIDNGSAMPAYFKTDIYIKNPTNIGYGPAINQGIKLARGKYIVPMNNDVFVKPGWLDKLVEEVEKDDKIGVIRPIQVGQSAYGNEKRKFGQTEISVDKKDYHGFCYLIPKDVLSAVGMFDEQFVPGYCEDMDMWVRLDKAGYKMVKHYGSMVEHLGGKTSSSVNIGDSLKENRIRFKAKWGFDVFSEEWYTNWQELMSQFGSV